MDYMAILESTIAASNDRDTTLEAVEDNLKKLQKMLAIVG